MIDFNPRIKAVLKEYHERITDETKLMAELPMEEGIKRRDEFLLSIGYETAVFLNGMIKSSKSVSILEIGASYGYSTIWLAEAARENKGKVISLEIDKTKIAYAKEKLEDCGLSDFVEFRQGDALEELKNIKEKFDFVLVDIWKEIYVDCFDLFYPKLKKNAWVIADNMIFPPHSNLETKAYRNRLHKKGTFASILLPIGSGMEVSNYIK